MWTLISLNKLVDFVDHPLLNPVEKRLKREDEFLEMPLKILDIILKMTYGLFDLCWNIDLH